MTIKKMKIYLATDIDKEADWLTDMSNKGFHFFNSTFAVEKVE